MKKLTKLASLATVSVLSIGAIAGCSKEKKEITVQNNYLETITKEQLSEFLKNKINSFSKFTYKYNSNLKSTNADNKDTSTISSTGNFMTNPFIRFSVGNMKMEENINGTKTNSEAYGESGVLYLSNATTNIAVSDPMELKDKTLYDCASLFYNVLYNKPELKLSDYITIDSTSNDNGNTSTEDTKKIIENIKKEVVDNKTTIVINNNISKDTYSYVDDELVAINIISKTNNGDQIQENNVTYTRDENVEVLKSSRNYDMTKTAIKKYIENLKNKDIIMDKTDFHFDYVQTKKELAKGEKNTDVFIDGQLVKENNGANVYANITDNILNINYDVYLINNTYYLLDSSNNLYVKNPDKLDSKTLEKYSDGLAILTLCLETYDVNTTFPVDNPDLKFSFTKDGDLFTTTIDSDTNYKLSNKYLFKNKKAYKYSFFTSNTQENIIKDEMNISFIKNDFANVVLPENIEFEVK